MQVPSIVTSTYKSVCQIKCCTTIVAIHLWWQIYWGKTNTVLGGRVASHRAFVAFKFSRFYHLSASVLLSTQTGSEPVSSSLWIILVLPIGLCCVEIATTDIHTYVQSTSCSYVQPQITWLPAIQARLRNIWHTNFQCNVVLVTIHFHPTNLHFHSQNHKHEGEAPFIYCTQQWACTKSITNAFTFTKVTLYLHGVHIPRVHLICSLIPPILVPY